MTQDDLRPDEVAVFFAREIVVFVLLGVAPGWFDLLTRPDLVLLITTLFCGWIALALAGVRLLLFVAVLVPAAAVILRAAAFFVALVLAGEFLAALAFLAFVPTGTFFLGGTESDFFFVAATFFSRRVCLALTMEAAG